MQFTATTNHRIYISSRCVFIVYAVLVGCSLATQVRIDCFPELGANQGKCEERGCTWLNAEQDNRNEPWCFFKEGLGYTKASTNGSVITLQKDEAVKNPWATEENPDLQQIFFASRLLGKVLNIKINAPERYDPPTDMFPNLLKPWKENSGPIPENAFSLTTKGEGGFSFTVARASTNTILFDSSIGALIFSDKFLQIATSLPSENMFGWGENVHLKLKHDFTKWTTWAMFARDEPTNARHVGTRNVYGVHPFYMVIEPDGNAHGVLILNSNAQDITTAPGPALIYRTIGGNLNLFFFPGPTPEEVTQQYLEMIGKPFLPAYWAFGFQISRWGYHTFENLKKVIERNIEAGVPLDVVVCDIDYMDENRDFTVGKKFEGLPEYISSLRSREMRSVFMFDPAVPVDYEPFNRSLKAGARFVEWERKDQVMTSVQDLYPLAKDTKIMLGVVWPNVHVAFPDFLDPHNNTMAWWIDEFIKFHDKVSYDGIWIDMNEPANFGTNEDNPFYYTDTSLAHSKIPPLKCTVVGEGWEWDAPPYPTHAVFIDEGRSHLCSKTLCMNAVLGGGKQRFYNVKNLYGLSEAIVTSQAQYKATKKRGFVVSRSTFVSNGHYAGHWLGDNSAQWEDLRAGIIGVQEFNMFGIPYVGTDICGFNGDTNEELCLRWQQMGAFHSFMRNHNGLKEAPQDPAMWRSVTLATINANRFRYSYLPYLYSLHFNASLFGGTVVRPMFYEYPKDKITYTDTDYQFLWGRSMLIAPVVYQGARSVPTYVPQDEWYSLYVYKYGQRINSGKQYLPAPAFQHIPVLVRGGSIIPRQKPENTTDHTRKNPFELLIVPGDSDGRAAGFLYWDDGESIVESFETYPFFSWKFSFSLKEEQATLVIDRERSANLVIPILAKLEIFNYKFMPKFSEATLNGKKANLINVELSHYDNESKILYIHLRRKIDLAASNAEHLELTWKNQVGEDEEEEDEITSSTQAMIKSTPATTVTGEGFDYYEEEGTTTTKYKQEDKQKSALMCRCYSYILSAILFIIQTFYQLY
ncbi:unnamed protein product [Cylicocyclus nassatus]|uniref:P-type domain-containing protein n=1 Tax=Cylicocyclus nassatus TaxID=53992 RepID=A0AA36HAP0_CYLNA|nr:unnamed protein product [Cylicocyclus nassatus]